MANELKCPRDCEVKLKNNKERLDKIDTLIETKAKELWDRRDDDYKHWEGAMGERPKTRTLVWIFGPILTLTLFFIGWSFSSIKEGQSQAITTLEHHQKKSMEVLAGAQEKIEASLEKVEEQVTEIRLELKNHK